jgi:hypothetical protein
MSELMQPYHEMRRSVTSHPRVIAVTRRWAGCMRARGFQYSSPRVLAGAEDAAAIARPRDVDAQRRAREAMQAGRVCADETGLSEAMAQARVEREAEFVRTHKEPLDRHLARLRNQPPPP